MVCEQAAPKWHSPECYVCVRAFYVCVCVCVFAVNHHPKHHMNSRICLNYPKTICARIECYYECECHMPCVSEKNKRNGYVPPNQPKYISRTHYICHPHLFESIPLFTTVLWKVDSWSKNAPKSVTNKWYFAITPEHVRQTDIIDHCTFRCAIEK